MFTGDKSFRFTAEYVLLNQTFLSLWVLSTILKLYEMGSKFVKISDLRGYIVLMQQLRDNPSYTLRTKMREVLGGSPPNVFQQFSFSYFLSMILSVTHHTHDRVFDEVHV